MRLTFGTNLSSADSSKVHPVGSFHICYELLHVALSWNCSTMLQRNNSWHVADLHAGVSHGASVTLWTSELAARAARRGGSQRKPNAHQQPWRVVGKCLAKRSARSLARCACSFSALARRRAVTGQSSRVAAVSRNNVMVSQNSVCSLLFTPFTSTTRVMRTDSASTRLQLFFESHSLNHFLLKSRPLSLLSHSPNSSWCMRGNLLT